MSYPRVLILNTDSGLTKLTLNSLKKNSPDVKYDVVDCPHGKKIKTALMNTQQTTFVACSGVYLNLRASTFPPIDKMAKYHALFSSQAVFADNRLYKTHYDVNNISNLKNVIDLSVFIITPEKWDFCPDGDSGFYSKIDTRTMPRYMNHRNDPLVELSLNSHMSFQYGLVGETASVLNYVDHFKSGQATVNETYAYCFDLMEDCVEGVSPIYRENILKLAEKTKKRIAKIRSATNKANIGE